MQKVYFRVRAAVRGKVTRGGEKTNQPTHSTTNKEKKSAQDSLKLIFPKRITQLMLKEVTTSFFSARILPETAQICQ